MLTLYMPPAWAQADGGSSAAGSLYRPFRPSPEQFAAFAHAAAKRYSGEFAGRPRVRYWEALIEPNASAYLMPQFIDGQLASPGWYRGMVNAFADAVKSVHGDNLVIAGSLSPFAQESSTETIMAPMRFMRELLCVSADPEPHSTCSGRVRFDIWGHHPYTNGGPTHSGASTSSPDDASLGDLAAMARVLRAAQALGKIQSDSDVQFWVTEFSWDSDPPDTSGTAVPLGLEARWVAEAQFRSWAAGVSRFVWFGLRDSPYPTSPFQDGLYFAPDPSNLAEDEPKPVLSAFRFPFVALCEGDSAVVHIWGRTPGARPATVIVEEESGAGWRPWTTLTTDHDGIFEARLPAIAPTSTSHPPSVHSNAAVRGTVALPRRRRRRGGATVGAHVLAQLPPSTCVVPRGSGDPGAVGEGPFLRARLADDGEVSPSFSVAPPPEPAVTAFGG